MQGKIGCCCCCCLSSEAVVSPRTRFRVFTFCSVSVVSVPFFLRFLCSCLVLSCLVSPFFPITCDIPDLLLMDSRLDPGLQLGEFPFFLGELLFFWSFVIELWNSACHWVVEMLTVLMMKNVRVHEPVTFLTRVLSVWLTGKVAPDWVFQCKATPCRVRCAGTRHSPDATMIRARCSCQWEFMKKVFMLFLISRIYFLQKLNISVTNCLFGWRCRFRMNLQLFRIWWRWASIRYCACHDSTVVRLIIRRSECKEMSSWWRALSGGFFFFHVAAFICF